MKFGLKAEIIKQVNCIFAKYPQIKKAIIYGSRAKGNYKIGSDIDLSLIGEDLTLSVIYAVELEIDDLLLPYTFDISIFNQISNPDLTEHINREGLTFYTIQKIRKVIFLDIDGVLQPTSNQFRFKHDLEELKSKLAARFNNDEYLEMDQYDLGAVYYDWHEEAVENLRMICEKAQAEIIISSDWSTYSSLARLKDYFRIYDLDKYISDGLSSMAGAERWEKIAKYLKDHPDIGNFIIFDDRYYTDFKENFPDNFIHCKYNISEECYNQAMDILKG